jgi:hypothetical protein
MDKDVDEDLIEATIRRVAESKAAREAPPIEMPVAESIAPEIDTDGPSGEVTDSRDAAGEPDDDFQVMPTPLNAAARGRGVVRPQTSLERAMSTTPDEDAPDAGVPRAPTSLAQAMSTTPDDRDAGHAIPRAPISLSRAMSTTPDDDDAGHGAPRAPSSLSRAMSTTADYDDPQPVVTRGRPALARAAAVVPDHEPQRTPAADPDIARQLREITQRLDTIMALLEELTADQPPAVGGAWGAAQSSARASAPAALARPAIFRDDGARQPSPEPEPEIIDTRPIPKPLPPLQMEPKRGFDLLPRSYRITVEDKRRGVDLVPLHRALLGMDGVRDMSLLSYNNGVAIVALETTEELDPDSLGASVSRAMSRDARVEVHNEHTMVVKLADE